MVWIFWRKKKQNLAWNFRSFCCCSCFFWCFVFFWTIEHLKGEKNANNNKMPTELWTEKWWLKEFVRAITTQKVRCLSIDKMLRLLFYFISIYIPSYSRNYAYYDRIKTCQCPFFSWWLIKCLYRHFALYAEKRAIKWDTRQHRIHMIL